MPIKGAGGTAGGTPQFFIGLAMMIAGFYLLLNSIIVSPPAFGFGRAMFRIGPMPVTTGMILFPFIAGVALIFYNAKNWLGWLLAIGAVIALMAGVVASIEFRFARLSAFDILVILVLAFGGLGLLLRSLIDQSRS